MPENSIGPTPDEIAKKPPSHPAKRLTVDMLGPGAADILKQMYPDQNKSRESVEETTASPTSQQVLESSKPTVVSHPAQRLNTGMLTPKPPITPKGK